MTKIYQARLCGNIVGKEVWVDVSAQAYAVYRDDCRRVVYDNAPHDGTPVVWRRWHGKFNCWEYTDEQNFDKSPGDDWTLVTRAPLYQMRYFSDDHGVWRDCTAGEYELTLQSHRRIV